MNLLNNNLKAEVADIKVAELAAIVGGDLFNTPPPVAAEQPPVFRPNPKGPGDSALINLLPPLPGHASGGASNIDNPQIVPFF